MGQDIQPQDDAQNRGYNLWKSIGFFNGQEYLSFIFKKTEKISSAIYLISALFKDTEPVKWELREKAVNLLLSAIAVNSSEPVDKNAVVQNFFSDSLETVSLLNMSLLAGLISTMNHSIIVQELESVAALLRTKVSSDVAKAGYILSDSFFKTEPPFSKTDFPTERESQGQSLFISATSAKEKNAPVSRNQAFISKDRKNNSPLQPIQKKIAVKDKKDGRKSAILALLKKKSHLTIKDFSQAIHGCSAKTIQRELLDLVAKGIVKKEGERRWSTYSLVSIGPNAS